MSFNNTKTPLKPTDERKVRYQVPKRRNEKAGVMEYYLTPELEQKMRELFPVTMNPVLMQWFGISHSTLHRFARELGLVKDRAVILKKHASQVKAICRKNGWYDSLKGKQPSEQCKEATRKLRAEGFHPLRRLKEINPRKFKALQRRKGKNRKELIAKERRRYQLTLMPLTDLPAHLYSGDHYTRYETHVRSYAKKNGYILGSIDPDAGERMMLYYTDDTTRLPKFEKSAMLRGFEFRRLSSRGKILSFQKQYLSTRLGE